MSAPAPKKNGKEPPAPAKKTKMMALSTLVNPLNTDQVMVFSSEGEDYKLGLHFRPLDGSRIQSFGSALEKSVATPLRSPSTLVTMIHDHAICVYGVTDGDNHLCLVSPVLATIPDTTVENGNIAGCLDSGDNVYLYYQAPDEDGEAKLFERSFRTGSSNASPLEPSDFAEKTNLHAFYDGTNRWLIYQKRDNTVVFWNVTANQDYTVYDSKKNACPATPLVTCLVPGDEKLGRGPRVYVYFVDSDKYLYRAWSDAGNSLSFSNPEQRPTRVNDKRVQPWSQMSVVPDASKGQNIIYAVQLGSNEISAVPDVWQAKKSEK